LYLIYWSLKYLLNEAFYLELSIIGNLWNFIHKYFLDINRKENKKYF
jgi:hypothetical protein